MRNGLIRLSRAALCVAACFGAAQAAPTLPKVVAGQASFNQQGNVFSITNTPGTIINWQSFSVNAGEVTRFIQQSSDSAVLNRIVGQDPSRILGALQSNGKVFVINPNGVVFGRDARVDVGGLVASTLNLSDADFLAGNKNFTTGREAGAVRNEGAITTPSGGKVFLVAPNVENSGVITAPNGEVVLAAGRSVQLVDSGNPDLSVVVSAPQDKAINLGQVVAQGGRIGIYGALVNQRGVANANSAVRGQDGKIILKASRDTLLEQGSVTSATGVGKGGEIQLLGQRVGLSGNAAVDASGAQGGGAVLVGGDYQGKNAMLPNAQQAWFGKDASIRADAIDSGNGGKVVLWSDGATAAYGSISARGAGAGNGGLVETSGHELDINGIRVDAGASKGRSGTWLLDPWDIVVANDGTAAASEVNVFSKPPSTGVTRISPATLAATNADIVLQAQNDLTIANDLVTTHSVRAEANNNLTVNALVQAGGDIDLRARQRFTLNADGKLLSPGFIDLKADSMTLAGSIDGLDGVLPTLTFSSFNNATTIAVRGVEGGGLTLDPARLAAFKAFEINLGNSAHLGSINIDAPLTLAGNLAIDTRGSINVNAPVRLTGAASQFVGTLHPSTTANTITVGGGAAIEATNKITLGGGRVNLGGDLKSTAIEIKAGNKDIELGGNLDASGRVTLQSSAALYQSGDSAIKAQELLVEAGSVNLMGDNQVGTLAGAALGDEGAGFRFNWSGDLHVGTVGGVSGLVSPNDATLTGDALIVDSIIDARVIVADAASIGGTGALKATVLSLESRGGIGSAATPLLTRADILMNATNTASGSAPINIVNDRALILGNVVQAGEGNAGAISIESTGGLTVGPTESFEDGVKTSSGNIRLVTHSPLTVQGKVTTESGNISLQANNGGLLTIAASGQVASSSGNVSISAGSTAIAPGSILVSNPDKLTVTTTSPNQPEQPAPSLDVCLANPNATGCGRVLETATQTCLASPEAPGCGVVLETATRSCTANPTGPGCAQVLERDAIRQCIANPDGQGCGSTLPPYPTCVAAPSTYGCAPVISREPVRQCIANPDATACSTVLPTYQACVAAPSTYGCAPVISREPVRQCIANPDATGCATTLPTYQACVAAPSTYGCAPVISREPVKQCIANPDATGCGSTLPSYQACVAAPSTYGCAPVIQREPVRQCIANPDATGCASTLPAYQACVAAPATYGCATVIQREPIKQCIADPKGTNCAAILPPLAQCRTDGTLFGCAPVLLRAEFDACLVNPTGTGCAARLPALEVCKLTPGIEGCTQVRQLVFNACLVTPNDAACAGILPTLSQCVADKTGAGCQAVLPTISQCIGSPTLQGCAVQLPKLEQCAANPQIQGCVVVLPKPDFCSTNPKHPSCTVFDPNATQGGAQGKSPVVVSQLATVNLVNSRTPVQPGAAPGVPGTPVTPDGGAGAGGGAATGPSESQADAKAETKTGPAGSNTGVKNEKTVKKMYCN